MTDNITAVNVIFLPKQNYYAIRTMTLEQKGMLLDAIFQYYLGEHFEITDSNVNLAFQFLKREFDENARRYVEKCRARSEAGKKGGRPRKNQSVSENPNGSEKSNRFSSKTKKANAFFDNQMKPNETTSDFLTDSSEPESFDAIYARYGEPEADNTKSQCIENTDKLNTEKAKKPIAFFDKQNNPNNNNNYNNNMSDFSGEKSGECDAAGEEGNEAESEPKEKQIDPAYLTLARQFQTYLANTQGNLAPKVTPSLIKNAALTLDKAVRLDGFNLDEIEQALAWAVEDSFWGRNALSIASLRNKMKDGRTKLQGIMTGYRQSQRKPHKSHDAIN